MTVNLWVASHLTVKIVLYVAVIFFQKMNIYVLYFCIFLFFNFLYCTMLFIKMLERKLELYIYSLLYQNFLYPSNFLLCVWKLYVHLWHRKKKDDLIKNNLHWTNIFWSGSLDTLIILFILTRRLSWN